VPTPSAIDNFMAVVGLPFGFAVTSLGIGLFIERVVGAALPNALLIPLGVCGSIVTSLAIYWTGAGDVPAVILTIALTVAGGVVARGGLRSRVNLGWPGLAGLATFVLFIAPELLTGHWTWSGYNFVNDTATQWLLAAYMKSHGTVAVGLFPPRSTATEFVRVYLASAYPLGTHAQLATLSGLLRTPPPVLYQGYISALAAASAMSLATLADRFLGPMASALAGFIAAGAALTYQYALQGNVKELGALATGATALAIARHVVREGIDIRGAVLAAVPLAALLDTYYSAGVPFAGAVAAAAVALGFLARRRLPNWRIARALVLSLVATVVLAAPASASIARSFNVVSSGFSNGGAAPSLGQLARPLPLSEVSGIWLTGDYRLPVVLEPRAKLTAMLTGVVFALALMGALLALRAREAGPAALLAAMGLVMVVILPRVSPYAAAKVLAIASPAFVFAALVGALGLHVIARSMRGSRRVALEAAGLSAAVAVGVGVIASDALAYHHDNIAPTSRMLAIEQVGDHFAGQGLILWNEFEEYAKYFAGRARINVPFETLTPHQAQLLTPNSIYAAYYDLDDEQLAFVESFPIIVTRRSPSASRPPANYRLAYVNSYYQAWVGHSRPTVLRHLGLQSLYSATAPASCATLRAFVAAAPRASYLIAASHPAVSSFDPGSAAHAAGWVTDPVHPDALVTHVPGTLQGSVSAPQTDRYQLWIQGSFPRSLAVQVDGRTIGKVAGVNTVNQWLSPGSLLLARGPHEIRLARASGGLAPGDGGDAWVGPVAIVEHQPERLRPAPLKRWPSLCNQRLDWVELVRR
jgi:hypothetical protein